MGKMTIENSSLVLNIGNVGYELDYFLSATVNDPSENQLTGSPQQKGDGISYKQGVTQPVSFDAVARNMPKEMFDAVKAAFKSGDRIQVLCADVDKGENHQLSAATVRSNPSNGTITEGETVFDVPLNFQCTQNNYKHTYPEDE